MVPQCNFCPDVRSKSTKCPVCPVVSTRGVRPHCISGSGNNWFLPGVFPGDSCISRIYWTYFRPDLAVLFPGCHPLHTHSSGTRTDPHDFITGSIKNGTPMGFIVNNSGSGRNSRRLLIMVKSSVVLSS